MLSLSRMQRFCRRLARVRPPAPPSAACPRLLSGEPARQGRGRGAARPKLGDAHLTTTNNECIGFFSNVSAHHNPSSLSSSSSPSGAGAPTCGGGGGGGRVDGGAACSPEPSRTASRSRTPFSTHTPAAAAARASHVSAKRQPSKRQPHVSLRGRRADWQAGRAYRMLAPS